LLTASSPSRARSSSKRKKDHLAERSYGAFAHCVCPTASTPRSRQGRAQGDGGKEARDREGRAQDRDQVSLNWKRSRCCCLAASQQHRVISKGRAAPNDLKHRIIAALHRNAHRCHAPALVASRRDCGGHRLCRITPGVSHVLGRVYLSLVFLCRRRQCGHPHAFRARTADGVECCGPVLNPPSNLQLDRRYQQQIGSAPKCRRSTAHLLCAECR
jgi:hypothetical protein